MKYTAQISEEAEDEINKLHPRMGIRVKEAIKKLENNPRPTGAIKLKGSEKWRIRVGDYRVIYFIRDNELFVFVVTVGHRGNVYRGL